MIQNLQVLLHIDIFYHNQSSGFFFFIIFSIKKKYVFDIFIKESQCEFQIYTNCMLIRSVSNLNIWCSSNLRTSSFYLWNINVSIYCKDSLKSLVVCSSPLVSDIMNCIHTLKYVSTPSHIIVCVCSVSHFA